MSLLGFVLTVHPHCMLGLCGLGQDSFHKPSKEALGPRCNVIERQVHRRIIASELYWALEVSVPFIKMGFILLFWLIF